MKAGDIFPSAPEPNSPLESPPLTHQGFESDRFDTFMQRARERSATHNTKRDDSSDDLSSAENKKVRSRKVGLKTAEQTAVGNDGTLQASSASVAPAPTAPFGTTPLQSASEKNSPDSDEANVSGVSAIAGPSSGTGAADNSNSSATPSDTTTANDIGEPAATKKSPAAALQKEKSNSSPDKSSASSTNTKSDLEIDSDKPATDASSSPESPKETERSVPPLVLAAQSENTGISSAKYDSPMEKAENMNEFSGTPEQYLPDAASSATAEAPRTFVVRPVSSTERQDKMESFSAFSASTTAIAPTDTFPTTAQEPASISLQSLERTHELISLHSVQLRTSGNDSLQVVIKPGVDLHLSLNLQMRDGKVEVQALLHRGDFNALSRHWTELQQQLETRGVRLAPLSDDRNSQFSDLSQQSGGRRQTGESATRTGAFAEFALSGTLVPKASTKTISRNGWESWA